jgi:septal ring factor EnvC (AmiA/AmiB activator)
MQSPHPLAEQNVLLQALMNRNARLVQIEQQLPEIQKEIAAIKEENEQLKAQIKKLGVAASDND